ncbi:carbohydrate kinase family protein [Streptomyces sp. NPDC048337]|uniref:carbohydrate kinase family protein n=1 Tax=Streptomyces sp. NPDC048337 TaxID=3365535 RepID=UPI0037138505
MRIAVTGSIATDHLTVFPGRFRDQLIPDQLDHVSLSFLADTLEVRRGGVAANIAVGLARLALTPVLVGAAGQDFADYAAWLENNGVDTASVRVSATLHTARFMCTTDADHNQIATFYAGAMAEARHISLATVAERTGTPDLVVIAPNDPEAMLRHTDECRRLGIPFAADPSQQLARLDRDETRRLITGARFLFTNAYEAALLLQRTGWTREEVLARIGTWITTLGAEGARLETHNGQPHPHVHSAGPLAPDSAGPLAPDSAGPLAPHPAGPPDPHPHGHPDPDPHPHPAPTHVPALPSPAPTDPTGVGDAFRSGFLAAVARGLPAPTAARLGCAMATLVLESVGTQEYKIVPADLLRRITDTYGPHETAALAPLLTDLP